MMKHDLWSRGRFGFWIFGWPEGMGPTTARRVMGELRRPPAEWSEASRSSTTIGDQRTIGDQITDMERKRRSQRVFLASIDHVHRWAWVGGPCPWHRPQASARSSRRSELWQVALAGCLVAWPITGLLVRHFPRRRQEHCCNFTVPSKESREGHNLSGLAYRCA